MKHSNPKARNARRNRKQDPLCIKTNWSISSTDRIWVAFSKQRTARTKVLGINEHRGMEVQEGLNVWPHWWTWSDRKARHWSDEGQIRIRVLWQTFSRWEIWGSEKFSHSTKFLLSHTGSKVPTPTEHRTWVRLTPTDLLVNYLRDGCQRHKHSDSSIYHN